MQRIISELTKFVKTDMSDREIRGLSWKENAKIALFKTHSVLCVLLALYGFVWIMRHA